MMNSAAVLLLLLLAGARFPTETVDEDSDHDGLSDRLEQALLTRFQPTFMISAGECDGLPAEFEPDSNEPGLHARNGTIYGQVFPAGTPGKAGPVVEIHFYHLWTRDCGKNGHELDAEHVSALVGAPAASNSGSGWKALYWYAAAHQDTLCDAGHGARSAEIGAEERGPVVWISGGKHASFLDLRSCGGGCGGDDCAGSTTMATFRVVNLGELSAPMNGSLWIRSTRWSLGSKMQTDFSEPVQARLETSRDSAIVALNSAPGAVKSIARAGGATSGALSTADQKADAAVSGADARTGHAIDTAARKAGRSLKRAARFVFGLPRAPEE